MKRLLTIILAFALISAVSPSMAKPVAEEFRNSGYDYSSIKTVLVLPVMYEISIPPSEPFLDDSVQQKWRELTSQEKSGFNFLVKTPEEIIEKDNFVKGTGPSEKLSRDKVAEKALSLSPEYADAILSATVTKCAYNTIHHPQELVWDTRYENRSVYVNGKWENAERTSKLPEDQARMGRNICSRGHKARRKELEGQYPDLRRDRNRHHRRGPFHSTAYTDETYHKYCGERGQEGT